jgi:hypothetical protein
VPAVSPAAFLFRRAERFAQLLDEANGGRRRHARSRLDAELAELVAVGHRVASASPDVGVDPEFRSGLRAMLVATAEREGIGATAPGGSRSPASARLARSPAERRPAGRPATAGNRPARSANRGRARGAIIVGVAVGAIAVSGMSAASEKAMPGDALYGVKRSTEKAQLALAGSDVTRGQLYLDFARSRAEEAWVVRSDSDGFAAALSDMDADTRQGVRLLTSAAVQRRDPAALDMLEKFVGDQRQRIARVLVEVFDADRERALQSLSVLDAVGKRADALRPALSCGASAGAGTDALGPLPRLCGVAAADPALRGTDPRDPAAQPGTGVHPSTAPGGTTPVPASSSGSPATTDDAPTGQPGEAEDDGGLIGALGRILGSLLD